MRPGSSLIIPAATTAATAANSPLPLLLYCCPYRLARRVRERSFLKMLQMDVAWYDRPENTAGSLAQQLATDCMMVKALTGERASTSASQMVTFAVSFAIAFWECWEMTLVMVGLFPLIGAAFAIQHSFVSQAAGAAMEATNEAGQVASQTLLNIRTINAFGLEKIGRCSPIPVNECL